MEIIKKEVEIKYLDEREGEIKNSYADINKAKKILDYEPQWNLKKGLHKTINLMNID